MALHELRIYHTIPGKLPELHNRFATVTCDMFAKHGIKQVAYWDVVAGTSNILYYVLEWASLAEREQKWEAFVSDPDWIAARNRTEANGPLVSKVENIFLKPTAYSPLK